MRAVSRVRAIFKSDQITLPRNPKGQRNDKMANKPRKRGGGDNSGEGNKSHDEIPSTELSELPLDALRRFRHAYNMSVREPMTPKGFMLQSEVGGYTWTSRNSDRAPAEEVQRDVRDRLRGESVQEGDAIAAFLYTVVNKDSVFKMNFAPRPEKEVPSGDINL